MLKFWFDPTVKDAYRLSIASVIISCIGIFCGFDLYNETGYSLCLGYAIENSICCLSSGVMLWRFFAPGTCDELSVAKLQGREQRATVAVTIILFFLGLTLFSSSIRSINGYVFAELGIIPNTDTNQEIELQLAVWSFIAFCVLGMLKYRYARILQSESLQKDAYCTLICVIIAVLIFFNTVSVIENPKFWWVNPVIAMFIGFAIALKSFKSLNNARKHESVMWYKSSFWRSSPNEKESDTNDDSVSNRANSAILEEVTIDEKDEQGRDLV